jgi:hypothetical protein
VDEREVTRAGLVEARRDSAEALEVVEEDLDEIALPYSARFFGIFRFRSGFELMTALMPRAFNSARNSFES